MNTPRSTATALVGVFGGTFDPVHYGHLRSGLELVERLQLEQLRLMPNAQPPHRDTPHCSAEHRAAMVELREYLTTLPEGIPSEDIQTRIYEIGVKHYSKETLREWFKANYELLLGSSQGPRMGSFIALFGAQGTIGLIDAALAQQVAA